jgi:hypothetical protein
LLMDLNTKYGAFASSSSLNIVTNTINKFRLRDIVSFLLQKKNRQRNQESDSGIFKWIAKGSTQHLPSSFLKTNRSWRWINAWLVGLRKDYDSGPTNSSKCRNGYTAAFMQTDSRTISLPISQNTK